MILLYKADPVEDASIFETPTDQGFSGRVNLPGFDISFGGGGTTVPPGTTQPAPAPPSTTTKIGAGVGGILVLGLIGLGAWLILR